MQVIPRVEQSPQVIFAAALGVLGAHINAAATQKAILTW
jgi:hypothetical protein